MNSWKETEMRGVSRPGGAGTAAGALGALLALLLVLLLGVGADRAPGAAAVPFDALVHLPNGSTSVELGR